MWAEAGTAGCRTNPSQRNSVITKRKSALGLEGLSNSWEKQLSSPALCLQRRHTQGAGHQGLRGGGGNTRTIGFQQSLNPPAANLASFLITQVGEINSGSVTNYLKRLLRGLSLWQPLPLVFLQSVGGYFVHVHGALVWQGSFITVVCILEGCK